jgi:hypothetical protein
MGLKLSEILLILLILLVLAVPLAVVFAAVRYLKKKSLADRERTRRARCCGFSAHGGVSGWRCIARCRIAALRRASAARARAQRSKLPRSPLVSG